MAHPLKLTTTLHHRRMFFIAAVFFITVSFHGTSQGAVPPAIDCVKWIDTMVVAGNRYLNNNKIDSARICFSAAYECGMSKDSMYYFAAEMYLRSGVMDTALVFNWALERHGKFDRETCRLQRERILRLKKRTKHTGPLPLENTDGRTSEQKISLNLSAVRNVMKLNSVSFVPYPITFHPDADVDDAGASGANYLFSHATGNAVRRVFFRVSLQSELPLPTRYSFRDENDTLMGSVEVIGGIGKAPVTPEFFTGYQMRIHSDLKKDNYFRTGFTGVFGTTNILSGESELKQIPGEGIDEIRTEVTFKKLLPTLRHWRYTALTLKHFFSRTDMYQEEVGVFATLYPLLPVGYVDSIVPGTRFRYYRDAARTIAFDSYFLDEYWRDQQGMKLMRPLPEHNFNLTFRNAWRFTLPYGLRCDLYNVVTGLLYTKPVEWYEPTEPLGDEIGYILENMYLKYAIIRNGTDGKYYLNRERSDLYANSVIGLNHYRKTRADCYLALSIRFQRNVSSVGTLYFSTGYIKGFSTIDPGDPVATFNYSWDLQAGWRMEFSLGKR